MKPSEASYYGCRGDFYRQMGEMNRAIADFRKAVDMDPRHSKYRDSLARTFIASGKVQDSIKGEHTHESVSRPE